MLLTHRETKTIGKKKIEVIITTRDGYWRKAGNNRWVEER